MGINTFNIAAPGMAVAVPTAKQRSLQNGTPKVLPTGEARACYAMLSYNTTNGSGGLAFYDKFFQPVRAGSVPYSFSSSNTGNYHYASGGDSQNYAGLFGGSITSTVTQASSTGTNTFMNATNAAGEFGNCFIDAFSNSSATPATTRNASWNIKFYLNQMFVDSDHQDKAIVYLLNGTNFRAVSRVDGDYSYDYYGTQSATITGVDANMLGSASYNAVRKELVILSYVAGGGSFNLITYQGIDFDKFPSPHLAFAAPGVVRTVKAISFASGWSGNDTETLYNIKPTLCDNGDIYVTNMHPHSSLYLWKVVRDAALTPTVTGLGPKTITTSYGRDQGLYYGQRRIQSRDGGAVLAFCPYYYYGSGVRTYVIDKRLSVVSASSMFDVSDTAAGHQPMPYGDSGFASYFCGNAYAGNYTGSYITAFMERCSSGLVQTGSPIYLPYFPTPNTTNYPGFTQVTDYSLLDNQVLV